MPKSASPHFVSPKLTPSTLTLPGFAGPTRNRYLLHARLLWRAAPGLSTFCLLLSLIQAGAAVGAMITSGQLIGTLSDADIEGRAAAGWLLLIAGCFVVAALSGAASHGVQELINARYLGAYQDLLLDTAIAPTTVEVLQSSEGTRSLDNAALALQHWLFLRGVGGIWGVISHRIAGIGSLIIMISWRWWVGALLVAGWLLMGRAAARWRSLILDDTEERAVPLRHRAAYLGRLVVGRDAAKEIRLFGVAEWLLQTYGELWRTAMALIAGRRGEGVRRTVGPLVILLVLHGGAFAMLIMDVGTHRVTVAALATVMQAILELSEFGRQDDDESSTGRTATELARLIRLRSAVGLPVLATTPVPPAADRVHRNAVRVEISGLTFAYPGQETPVLEGVDLTIEPGECVAIVGVNGAGKSTLLNLLCGLWQPDRGTVLIDGQPPTQPEVRSRIAPIFQTFVRFPLSAQANITAGNQWREATGWRAAADAAGATQVVDRLASGADTTLSSQFTGGTDLSGGQWQRVALARALCAIDAGAGLLALDEPTAALDVRAEVALFEAVLGIDTRLADQGLGSHATQGNRGRPTTVLITHRLSSVRHADRIVVLGSTPGRGASVVENGTHQELIKLDGRYAEMYGLQAARFAGSPS